jgi:hypothetical protein
MNRGLYGGEVHETPQHQVREHQYDGKNPVEDGTAHNGFRY